MNFADRVKDTTATTGTGSIALSGSAPSGFRAFGSAFSVGDAEIGYCISDDADTAWEVGYGTLSASTTLDRSTVLASSNGGALVNFAAGTKSVFCTIPAAAVEDLAANRILSSAPISTGLNAATDQLSLVVGGAPRRMAIADFLSELGESVAELPSAAALSGTDILSINQGGVSEVKTTLSAIAAFIASTISGGSAVAPGANLSGTSSISAGTATGGSGGSNATASGATLTGTSSLSAGTATGGGGVAYTITGYSGNAVKSEIDFAAAGKYAGKKYAPSQFTANNYWTISPSPASAVGGWGTSPTVPPDTITQVQNNGSGGGQMNGMTPMSNPAAFASNAYLWVTTGSGTSTWYYWIKPVDGVAQCINPTGTVVINA